MIKKCFFCGEEIKEGEGRIVPLDKPYVNIWAHREGCADAMDYAYLYENIDRIMEYAASQQGIKKKNNKE